MTSPNIEHIHYFTTVVETGSFTAAGRKLGRDRSSVGQAIANLEIDLDVQLFERNGRNITLTPEGESLYTRARTLLQGYQSFCQFSQNLTSDIESSLTVGIDNFTGFEELASIDRAMALKFPGLTIHWQRHPTDQLDAHLESGAIDVVLRLFQNRDLPEDYHLRHVDNITMVSIVHRQAETVTIIHHSDLRTMPLVTYPDAEKIVRSDRFEHIQNTFSPEAALEIIAKRPGWGIFPLKAISPDSPHYQPIDLDTTDAINMRRIVVWHHRKKFGQAKRWLIENLKSLLET
ncbi:LysR family transcriptional regulator [Vibrio sp. WXL103]|uniref:LysR family transcriptional regulator n=1 Tax=Vibrio sp. WXL103 TaxID=3450710 RepID=UPI003EC7702E